MGALISTVVSIGAAIGGFLWRKRVIVSAAASGAAAGYAMGKDATASAKAEAEADRLRFEKWKKIATAFMWIAISCAFLFFAIWFLKKKPGSNKKSDSKDFYAGALGLDPEQAAKVSESFLKGQLSAKKHEARWGNPGEILGLRPTGVQAFYGRNGGGGSYDRTK
ncbi:MAG: hypothetical protein JSR44_09505 [Spirochaetes bacterium]|nr:hypothetical protein [Spirochaetota bacterium]